MGSKIALAVAASLCLFMGQTFGRALYIHFLEFRPAVVDFYKAKERSDYPEMEAAYGRMRRASERTLNPLWFMEGKS